MAHTGVRIEAPLVRCSEHSGGPEGKEIFQVLCHLKAYSRDGGEFRYGAYIPVAADVIEDGGYLERGEEACGAELGAARAVEVQRMVRKALVAFEFAFGEFLQGGGSAQAQHCLLEGIIINLCGSQA